MTKEKSQLIKKIAPGQEFRKGLDNVLRAGTGGLFVIGYRQEIRDLIHGGFEINCPYSPANLYELAKMDGAIILSDDTKKILFANTELSPDPRIPTSETGTRHRSAERFALQTEEMVIAVSQRRNVITMYKGSFRYVLKDLSTIFAQANQVLQRLEKLKNNFDVELDKLSQLEIHRSVSLYDVLQILYQAMTILQLKQAIQESIYELGVEGKLLELHIQDLTIEEPTLLLLKDYMDVSVSLSPLEAFQKLQNIFYEPSQMKDSSLLKLLGFSSQISHFNQPIVPLGYRILSKIHRLPNSVIEKVVQRFGHLNTILESPVEQLNKVEGIGEKRAKKIKTWLDSTKTKRVFF